MKLRIPGLIGLLILLLFGTNESSLAVRSQTMGGSVPHAGPMPLFTAQGAALDYATLLGDSANDEGYALAQDSAGNIYVMGKVWNSTGFPASAGAYDTSHNGKNDVFVAVFDPTLGDLRYATLLGGSDDDRGYALALDDEDNVYVLGETPSTDFPTTIGAYDPNHNGGWDIFVAVLDPTLSTLRYATFVGGTDGDFGRSLALDSAGNVYIAGYTWSNGLATLGAYDTSRGNRDVYIGVLDPTLSTLRYATYLGGSDGEFFGSIVLDNDDNVYVTGQTQSSDFPATVGAYDTGYNGTSDIYVGVLDPTLSNLRYATFLGGGVGEYGYDLVLDGDNNVYVTGYTQANFPTTAGAYDTIHNGGNDVFVSILDPTLADLRYATYIGGGGWDYARAIALDSEGNVYVAGRTPSADFPTTAGAHDTSLNGDNDAFVTVLDPTLGSLRYATLLGGSGDEYGYDLFLDAQDTLYVTGYTASDDFSIPSGAYDNTHNGAHDVFVSVLDISRYYVYLALLLRQ